MGDIQLDDCLMRSYVDTVMSDYQNISIVDRRASLYIKRAQINQVKYEIIFIPLFIKNIFDISYR